MPRTRYLAALACALFAVFAFAAPAGAITTTTVEYGPWTIPAGGGDPHDHETMGEISNEIRTEVARPCRGCKLVAADPEMVDATTGREVNINTGPMLHHFLFAASNRTDNTCPGRGAGVLGQRFFAAGNERTAIDIERLSYGYEVGESDRWTMVTDLMNWSRESRRVKIKVTFKYATGEEARRLTNLRPWWLDADGCSFDSLIEVPVGFSDTHRDITAPSAGRLIAAAGHIHDHGLNVELTNRSRSEASICNSVSRSGETEAYVTPDGRRHISSMTTCVGTPVAEISSGNTLRLHTQYEVPVGHPAINDAMGIMIGFVAP